jgi:hypothetical protein
MSDTGNEGLGFGAVRFSSSPVADASAETDKNTAKEGKSVNRSVRFSALEDGHGSEGRDQDDLEEASTRRSRRRRGRKIGPPTEPEHTNMTSLESLRPAARTTIAEDLPVDLVRECFSLCGSLQQALHADVLQVSPREEQALFTSTSTIGLMLNGTEIDNLVGLRVHTL